MGRSKARGNKIQPADFSEEMKYLLEQYGDHVASVTVSIVEVVADKTAVKKYRIHQ